MNNCKHLVWMIWLALLALPFNSALAQNEETSQNFLINPDHDRIIKLHPLQFGEVYISYEKMREDNISNEFGLSYVYRSYLNSDDFIPEGVKVGGVHIRMSQRHYTSKKQSGVPFGFFHGPMFGYRFLVFDKNLFTKGSEEDGSPNYSYVGRMYQNAIEVNYQLGGQFMLNKHFMLEISAALGARLKYVLAKNAGDLLPDNIIGHALVAEDNSGIFIAPSPQLNVSVGYSF